MIVTYAAPIRVDHFLLSFSLSRSATIRSDSKQNPPAPIPCTTRPKCKPEKFPDTAATNEPAVKNVTPVSSIALRPKMSEKAEYHGTVTAADTMKAIPSQNASRAEPWRWMDSVCILSTPFD
jgi:hypothetical protein